VARAGFRNLSEHFNGQFPLYETGLAAVTRSRYSRGMGRVTDTVLLASALCAIALAAIFLLR
jgi:hypothetical protein